MGTVCIFVAQDVERQYEAKRSSITVELELSVSYYMIASRVGYLKRICPLFLKLVTGRHLMR